VHEAPIRATGTVTRPLKPDLAEVRLPNGKITLGHFSRELRQQPPSLSPLRVGDTLDLELTPFDFDHARIVAVRPPQDAEA